jgi:hypothetical protein
VATDLTIHLDDSPGELARVTGLFGDAGVNILGFCAVGSGGGRAEVHLLVEDLEGAFTTLAAAGAHAVAEQEVLVVPVDDRPGILGEMARKLGDAGVNITLAYVATGPRLVFASDDLAAAKAALS